MDQSPQMEQMIVALRAAYAAYAVESDARHPIWSLNTLSTSL
jgi:hypothetical protein